MKKILPLALCVSFLVACQDQQPTEPLDGTSISLDMSDGATGGPIADFFFLPPLADNPSGNPIFDAGDFNEFLAPFVLICQLVGDDCVYIPGASDPEDLPMEEDPDPTKDEYKVGWQTGGFDLIDGETYRIEVWVGDVDELLENRLGFRDVKPLPNPNTASCFTGSGTICQINNGSNVPIKVWIGADAFCPRDEDGNVIECETRSVDLTAGVSVSVGGVDVDVPGSSTTGGGTVTFQPCQVDDVADLIDLPVFGPCLETVNLSPGSFTGQLALDATATLSFCNLDPDNDPVFDLSDAQQANIRIHHLSGETGEGPVEVLRDAGSCSGPAPERASLPSNPVQRFASRILSWVSPRPLVASTALFGSGYRGNSGSSILSKFTLALPAKIDFVNAADASRVALAGSSLPTQAIVTDLDGAPVAGARVRWNVAEPPAEGADVEGTVSPSSSTCAADTTDDVVCTTGTSGIVEVSWTLDIDPGTNKLTAGGRGIADSREAFNGPRGKEKDGDGNVVEYTTGPFDPFQPIENEESDDDLIEEQDDEGSEIVAEPTRLLFTAIGCEPGFGTPTDIDGTIGPGEWDCAIPETFPVNLSGGSTVDATLYYMNDDTDFHLAVVVPGTGRRNGLRIDWDANGNGNAFGREVGDDVWEFEPDEGPADKFIDDKCSTSSQSGCGNDDNRFGGSMDTYAAFDNSGGETVYEMSHPFTPGEVCTVVGGKKGCSSGFAIDLQRSADDPAGFFLTLRLGSGAQGNTQWPGFLDYHPITIR
jgi:hypothetical protein